jgi:hypothetical protein
MVSYVPWKSLPITGALTENEICVLGFSLRQRYKQTIPHTSSRIEELTVGIAFRNEVKHGSTT